MLNEIIAFTLLLVSPVVEYEMLALSAVLSFVIVTLFEPEDIFPIASIAYATKVFGPSTKGVVIEKFPFDIPVAINDAQLYIHIVVPVSAVQLITIPEALIT